MAYWAGGGSREPGRPWKLKPRQITVTRLLGNDHLGRALHRVRRLGQKRKYEFILIHDFYLDHATRIIAVRRADGEAVRWSDPGSRRRDIVSIKSHSWDAGNIRLNIGSGSRAPTRQSRTSEPPDTGPACGVPSRIGHEVVCIQGMAKAHDAEKHGQQEYEHQSAFEQGVAALVFCPSEQLTNSRLWLANQTTPRAQFSERPLTVRHA